MLKKFLKSKVLQTVVWMMINDYRNCHFIHVHLIFMTYNIVFKGRLCSISILSIFFSSNMLNPPNPSSTFYSCVTIKTHS